MASLFCCALRVSAFDNFPTHFAVNLENEIIHDRQIAFSPSEYKDYADGLKILPENS